VQLINEGGKMKKACLLCILIFLVSWAQPKSNVTKIQDEIRSVIDRQQIAWNNHNIKSFMVDYWKSEAMTFQSANNRLKGWDTLLNRYKTTYAGEKMGKLTFSDIEIYVLSSDYAYALGRWKVEQEESAKSGLFTIILKHFPTGWKIIHDHSS